MYSIVTRCPFPSSVGAAGYETKMIYGLEEENSLIAAPTETEHAKMG